MPRPENPFTWRIPIVSTSDVARTAAALLLERECCFPAFFFNPMPIRPQLRQFYGRQWREETRPRILERAQNKCEQCKAPNRQTVIRNHRDYPGWWFDFPDGSAHDNAGSLHGRVRLSEAPEMELVESGPGARLTEIVLTVAHLNQTPGDDRDENLKALCQWCHLHHDLDQHTRNSRETRLTRKDASRPLLQEFA